MSQPPRLLYVSFDEVPSPKGASTHIEAFVRALGRHFGSVVLVTPGSHDQAVREFAPGVRQIVLGSPGDNLLGRALTFRQKLLAFLQEETFDLIHFRSPYEGYTLAARKTWLGTRLLYEVNGLPSIEAKYSYPRLRDDDVLQRKFLHQEEACLAAADAIVTVSEVSREYLQTRGISAAKIRVIPNGIDNSIFFPSEPPVPENPLRLLYVGTLSIWQGVDVVLRAVHLVKDQVPLHLTLVGPALGGRGKELERLCDRLQIGANVTFLGPRPQSTVAELLRSSHASVVPLLPLDRNLVQGCCPLKLLEAMGAGCPVLASDLPVVRELAKPEEHFLPFASGDAVSLAESLKSFAADPVRGGPRALRAAEHVHRSYTWERATEALIACYHEVLGL